MGILDKEAWKALCLKGVAMCDLVAAGYGGFLVEIKARIRQAQYLALRAVNAKLVKLYWDIGEPIHQKCEVGGAGFARAYCPRGHRC